MKRRKINKMRFSNPVSFKSMPIPGDIDKLVLAISASRPKAGKLSDSNRILNDADLRTLAEAAISIWRAKQRIISASAATEGSAELKTVLRRIDSSLEQFEKFGLTFEDLTGKPYVQGMALNVISSQPNSALTSDRICETLKPTVYFKGKFVQAGDVIIEGPPSQENTTQQPGKAQHI